jgi:hypothetical protein
LVLDYLAVELKYLVENCEFLVLSQPFVALLDQKREVADFAEVSRHLFSG